MAIKSKSNDIKVKFEVIKIRHRNEDNGYTILEARFKEYPDGLFPPTSEILIVGNFMSIFEEDEFQGEGNWVNHKVFGYQLVLKEQKRIVPQSKKGIVEFLKRSVKGIGPKTAERIVEYFKEDTLSKIEQDWKNLLEIKGMGVKKAKKIHEELVKHKKFEDVAIFVLTNGLGYRVAMEIYENLLDASIPKIKDNPYCLCSMPKIGFKVADKFSNNLNLPFNNPDRIKEGILYFIETMARSKGDLYVEKTYLTLNITDFLVKIGSYGDEKNVPNITLLEIDTALKDLISNNKISIDKDELENMCIYLKKYYVIENKIVTALKKLIEEPKDPICTKSQIQEFIDDYEYKNSFKFAEKQKDSIFMALGNGISILTGGPGTGKTQTINSIIKCIKAVKPHAHIELCAPTGKASKRMTELTGMTAQTIHRLIGLNAFEKDKETTDIEGDYLIIDESSMIDAYVFFRLLNAIQDNTRILFVGDYEQLPSVGPGLILRDLINSNKIPVTTLTEIFRQARESQIVMNSHKIIQGKKTTDVDGLTFDNKKEDFYFFERKDRIKAQKTILECIDKFINNQGYKLSDIQVLSPMKKGDLGVRMLNTLIQQRFNPSGVNKEIKVGELMFFRKGDKVLQTINNYDLDVFNGEVGYISSISKDSDGDFEIEVDFGDKSVSYDNMNVEELELAYVITIHKSQGSEFPIVIMPIHSSQENMLNKNLIYTAWTRAKEKVICIGEKSALDISVDKNDNTVRNSRIREKIVKEINVA